MSNEKHLVYVEDAKKALLALRKGFRRVDEKCAVGACITELSDVPTVDAVPVVHGRWKQARYTQAPLYLCSECDKPEYKEHRYCPNCGAKMDL